MFASIQEALELFFSTTYARHGGACLYSTEVYLQTDREVQGVFANTENQIEANLGYMTSYQKDGRKERWREGGK